MCLRLKLLQKAEHSKHASEQRSAKGKSNCNHRDFPTRAKILLHSHLNPHAGEIRMITLFPVQSAQHTPMAHNVDGSVRFLTVTGWCTSNKVDTWTRVKHTSFHGELDESFFLAVQLGLNVLGWRNGGLNGSSLTGRSTHHRARTSSFVKLWWWVPCMPGVGPLCVS